MINPYEPPATDSEWSDTTPATRRPLDAWVILATGLLVPGLPSLLMRRSRRDVFRFLMLLLAIPMALLFFGPFWDLVLFAGTEYGEAGFYPFVATCCLTPMVSVWLGFRDRARLSPNQFENL